MSGWATATEHHRRARSAPLRTGAARVLVTAGSLSGQVPAILRRELRYQTFRRYCELNVALEATAELAYRRLLELSPDPDEHAAFERIHTDEARHAAAFRVLAGSLTDDDHPAPGTATATLQDSLAAISPWFVPATARRDGADQRRRFGSGARGRGAQRRQRRRPPPGPRRLPRRGRARLPRRGRTARPRSGCRSCSATTAATAPTSTTRSSSRASPGTCGATASRTSPCSRRPRCTATSSRSGPWPRSPRTSASPPTPTGSSTSARTCARSRFDRGFVQRTISGTWLDADLRIVMPKMRTDPTEFGHLGLSTLEGSTGAIDATFYAKRQVDFRSATMMLLDVAPPDFAVVDVWAPVADGPFGVMGCHRPAAVRHLYAGADALAVDEVVLEDLGIDDPRRAPIVRRAHHWFGLDRYHVAVDGVRPPLGAELRGAHASRAAAGPRHPVVPDLRVPEPGRGPLRPGDGHDRVPARAAGRPTRRESCGGRRSGRSGCGRRHGREVAGQARGVWDSFRGGHAAARALAVADSRSLVRSLFLASAVRLEVLPAMRTPRPVAALVDQLRCTRPDRLVAWLTVGVELGELTCRDDRYGVKGRRARALADGDPMLHAHYRSMLDYQAGVYADLATLLRDGPDEGRPDLQRHATVIAQVSLAAAPFVVPFLRASSARSPRPPRSMPGAAPASTSAVASTPTRPSRSTASTSRPTSSTPPARRSAGPAWTTGSGCTPGTSAAGHPRPGPATTICARQPPKHRCQSLQRRSGRRPCLESRRQNRSNLGGGRSRRMPSDRPGCR